MRDISHKATTLRIATAEVTLKVRPETITRVRNKDVPKGDVLEVAKIAGVQAAKNTSQIIPYCHPLPIDFVDITFALGESTVRITATVKAIYKTGVEMEALTAASVAALTFYDMLKMLDDTMEITLLRLVEKRGGKSDYRSQFAVPLRAAVLVMSDTAAAGTKQDLSGRLIEERLKDEGLTIEDYKVIPDDEPLIIGALSRYADELRLDLVVTTGGTGLGPRDTTPEAMAKVVEHTIPGIAETLRAYGQARTPNSMLSRGIAGVRGKTIIINLPGSKRAVVESLDALFPGLFHAFTMLRGGEHPPDQEQIEA